MILLASSLPGNKDAMIMRVSGTTARLPICPEMVNANTVIHLRARPGVEADPISATISVLTASLNVVLMPWLPYLQLAITVGWLQKGCSHASIPCCC